MMTAMTLQTYTTIVARYAANINCMRFGLAEVKFGLYTIMKLAWRRRPFWRVAKSARQHAPNALSCSVSAICRLLALLLCNHFLIYCSHSSSANRFSFPHASWLRALAQLQKSNNENACRECIPSNRRQSTADTNELDSQKRMHSHALTDWFILIVPLPHRARQMCNCACVACSDRKSMNHRDAAHYRLQSRQRDE